MANPQDKQDIFLERNLRMLGRVLELPARPGSSQGWKTRIAEPPARPTILRPRFVAALATAAAAALAFLAFMLPSGPGSSAVASTIFRSFREGSHRSLSFTFDRIESGGLLVSGRLQMIFGADVTLARLFRADDRPEPDWLGFQVRLSGTPSDAELDGLDCEIAASLAPSEPWAYVRLDQLPKKTATRAPFLGMLVPTLRSGLILELDNPRDLFDGLADCDGAAPRAAPTAAGRAADGPCVEEPLERLVIDFLSGRAGGDRMADLVASIEQVAGQVSTRRVGPAEWELRASRFHTADLGPEEAALLRDASLVIRYEQGLGLIDIELADVGREHGRIRLGFIDAVDPRLENKQLYAASGAQSLRLADVIKVFE